MRFAPANNAIVRLVLACSAVTAALAVAQSPATTPGSQPPASQPAAPRDVLNEMLAPTTQKLRPLQPILGDPVVNKATVNPIVPGYRPLTLKREGGYVVDRTGRVTPSADGKSFEFNFEADAQTLQDPPMILLPNLALMLMQDQLRLTGRDMKFRVTGIVTEYMGRNYLLLQKVVTVNEG